MKIRIVGKGMAVLTAGVIFAAPGRGNAEEAVVPAVQAEATPQPVTKPAGSVNWKDGFTLEASNGVASMRVGGRIQADAAAVFMSHPMRTANGGPAVDHAGFRRARFLFEGTLYKHVEYWNEIEVSGGSLRFADAYVGLKDGPGGLGFRFGHFKEPYGLEEQTSDSFVTFLERSLANTFSPGRNFGAMLYSDSIADGRITAAAGIYREVGDNSLFGDSVGENNTRKVNLTGRLTVAPLLENKGEKLLHVGFSYSRKEYPGGYASFSTRPEVGFFYSNVWSYTGATGSCPPPANPADPVPSCANSLGLSNGTVVDTGSIPDVRWGQIFNPELAVSMGPVSLQGEYTVAVLDTAAGSRYFHGAYGQAGVFLTGEHRPYAKGRFGRPKPKSVAFVDGGTGAVEVAFRASYLDLNNGTVNGGHAHGYTAVANWYMNPNARLSCNFAHVTTSRIAAPSATKRLPGYVNSLVFRFQVDI